MRWCRRFEFWWWCCASDAVVLQLGDGFDGFVLFHYYCFAFLLHLQSPVVVRLLRRLSSLSISRKPPRRLNLSPKHFFAVILALYGVAFVFCLWSLVAIVQ
jgi:hypothetical protein